MNPSRIPYDNFNWSLGRIEEVALSLHVAGVLLKTGQATDDDLQSLASMLTTNTLDIGNLDDFRFWCKNKSKITRLIQNELMNNVLKNWFCNPKIK